MCKVLIADDEPKVLLLIKNLIDWETLGLDLVATANDGVAALAAIAELRPDIVITAKGLASGFPLSVIAAPEELMSKAWPGSQGGTYGANAVACAAAVATLDVIRDEGLVANAAERGSLRLTPPELATTMPTSSPLSLNIPPPELPG